ncbi:hypothetical protein JOF56_010000 [Kibdelosporangium banguiense]|uniref:Uncharacterized protein n=1 Tax=Kibdelosporangium banguiense TaxID=1365924 RepID=A0ABS4U0A5_9PSEU|nr:hypothetical protein [Kibdelosporangium banguiense]MBP2329615.1 hypothetical protein [Kibdelosporangium banguiense]
MKRIVIAVGGTLGFVVGATVVEYSLRPVRDERPIELSAANALFDETVRRA